MLVIRGSDVLQNWRKDAEIAFKDHFGIKGDRVYDGARSPTTTKFLFSFLNQNTLVLYSIIVGCGCFLFCSLCYYCWLWLFSI